MFLLVYTTTHPSPTGKGIISTDKYLTFESLSLAQHAYNEVLEYDNLYSASIAGVIQSTDYESAKV